MRTPRSSFRAGLWVLAGLLALSTPSAASQIAERVADEPPEAFPAPEPSESLTNLLKQDYLSDAERRAIRLSHGLWDAADLADVKDRAQAALCSGDLSNASFEDDRVEASVRAEALWRRGEPERAISLLNGRTDARSRRIRAEALLSLGRTKDAMTDLDALLEQLKGPAITDPRELVECVRGMLVLAHLRASNEQGMVGYQDMLGMLARARESLDRLSWDAPLCEAQLLYEKDRFPEAVEAAGAALRLNPRCADAWALLGQMAVDAFDFPRAERIAARLDALAKEVGGEGATSIDRALIRARILLRRGEGESAAGELAPELVKHPACRRLLAWQAAASAGAFDFETTDQRLTALDTLEPGSPEGWMAVGLTVSSARQYDEAARYLTEACKRAPNWAEPFIELGLSELQAGRLDTSTTALERATALDRYNIRAANSLSLLRELNTYTSTESDHFIVRCKPGEDEIVAGEMLAPLEKIFDRVTGNGPGGIDHKPDHKTVVELYPNHRWFATRITGLPQLHTIAAATGPVIAMEAPREGPGHLAGPYDWRRVVQHEYTHTVTLSRTKNRLPHWFTEACAVYLEDSPRDWRVVQLLSSAYDNDGLFNLDDINVGFVRPRRPQDRQLAYAQGHWMYQYIVEKYGPRAPLDLMDLYATGVREEGAFEKILHTTRDQFLSDFKAWAGEQLVAWGMRATDKTPDVTMLLAAEADRLRASGSSEEPPTEPSPELIARWRTEHPADPFVLRLALDEGVKNAGGSLTPDLIPLAEAYAKARPVDPLPHKLLAALYLAGTPGHDASEAIEHLEYLDAREQSSNGYALELARLYAAKGDMDRAWAKALRATQIAPYDAKAREAAAALAIRRKDFAAAEHQIRVLIALEPDVELHKQRLEALKKLAGEK